MRRILPFCTLSLLLIATACSRGDSDTTAPDTEQDPGQSLAPDIEVYDPPRRFAPSSQVALPEAAALPPANGMSFPENGERAVTLVGTLAYVAVPDRLHVIDVMTGQTIEVIEPEGMPLATSEDTQYTGNTAHPPLVTEVAGSEAVLVPFLAEVPGSGTTADRNVIELVAVDAETQGVLWRHLIDAPDCADFAHDCELTVVGADNGVAVLSVVDSASSEFNTFGIDLTGPATVWERDDFNATMVTDDLTIGVQNRR
jgi:hypothetical protein